MEDEEGNHIESCWGYYGDYDDRDYSVVSEAQSVVDYLVKEEEADKWEKLAQTNAQLV